MKRRTFLKKLFSNFAKGALFTSIGYFYAKYIEPKRLVVHSYTIAHPLIPARFDGIKLLQFSDVHLGYYYDVDEFHKVVKRINSLRPHIVFFTGDLLDEPNRYDYTNEVTMLLKEISAPLGKFCIYGNHDHGGYGTDIYREIMTKAGFDLLVNDQKIIQLDEQNKIMIVGLDDFMLGKPDFTPIANQLSSSIYTIALLHEPDTADQTAQYPIHLQLSGHSHGGQIQLPFIGPLITPPLAKKYYEGFYDVEGMRLYVNRGLGTTRMPFRFLSPPELTMFTLKSKKVGSQR
jgi:predicted MPP superfamily phosphohydrolase